MLNSFRYSVHFKFLELFVFPFILHGAYIIGKINYNWLTNLNRTEIKTRQTTINTGLKLEICFI